jgi:hypothetical protein
MKGRELVRFKCWSGCRGNCPACQVTLNWNLMGKRCHCGVIATGYRSMGADIDVEFFCDEHFQDVPVESPQAADAVDPHAPHSTD